MNVIGLGKAGCKIAARLGQHPQYTCYKIDVGQEGERCYNFPAYESSEEYEEKVPDLKSFFKEINGEILFILAGGGAISCSSLRILEKLKSKNITVLYVQPEASLLNGTQFLRERMVRGVLQQYARSALFKRIYLVSNEILENIIGEVPIVGYFDKLNEVLVSTLHMINIFHNSEPAIGKIEKPRDMCRISTFGIFDSDKDEEKLFFPLDKLRDVCYIYGVNEEKLKTDGTLFRTITEQVKRKGSETIKVSYAVFETQYEDDISYCMAHASYIQP
tara:strand:+ start:3654 stop:4478 length:825 start_codon:yes stop_codon:yes gene_type:complete